MFDPLVWGFLLLAAGLAARKFRVSRWLCGAALIVLAFFSTPAGLITLLRPLESRYPDRGIDGIPAAQAIVVLGGNLHMPRGRHRYSGLIDESDRVLEALRLYRAGRAPLVVCSGGGGGETPEAQGVERLLEEWDVPSKAILVEDRSLSTRENALFSYSMLQDRGIRRILLVTSALHMPRAVSVFRRVGFEVSPAPADFRTGWGEISIRDWVPAADYLVKSGRALREWVALGVYRWRGWI